MERRTLPAATKPCPCGAGQVRVDVTLEDNGWAVDWDWHGTITCARCAREYSIVPFGRCAAVAPTAEVEHRRGLAAQADAAEHALLTSARTAAVLDRLAAELEALPTAAARHRLAHRLGIACETLPTFRKHTRGVPARRWLESWLNGISGLREPVARLHPLYIHTGEDALAIDACIAEASALRGRAVDPLTIVVEIGPINALAVCGAAGREAREARA